jgi:hypothetical protein
MPTEGALFLGENLLSWLLLAMGGALAVGNLLALVKPREAGSNRRRSKDDAATDEDLDRPPLARSLLMIGIGTIAAVWALASLAAG